MSSVTEFFKKGKRIKSHSIFGGIDDVIAEEHQCSR